ncbi:MAG: hypothetical protein R2784_06890 [Saprospiraceae bacterium]
MATNTCFALYNISDPLKFITMLLTKPSGVGLGVLILILFRFFSCNTLSSVSAPSDTTDAHPHSFSRPDEVKATHLDLDIKVDFDKKQIEGTAKMGYSNYQGG